MRQAKGKTRKRNIEKLEIPVLRPQAVGTGQQRVMFFGPHAAAQFMSFDKLNLNFRQHAQRAQPHARAVQLVCVLAGADLQLLARARYEP